MKAQHIGGQLERRYHLPYRAALTSAPPTASIAQAAYEVHLFALGTAINSGMNMLMHGSRLDGGRPVLLL